MKKIIFIDDDDDFREATASILEDEGYSVMAFEDARLIQNTLDNNKFDVALIDYSLPRENGIEVVKKLPNYKFGKNLIVIMISSHESIKTKVKEAGIKYFFPKPLDYNKLLNKIENLTTH